ncbi:hypothetical protein ACH9D2_14905 [Kocuria sp. M4R2S49]|uniref:hypothetical protein n=1 Tax=Kocuria rhizosphaericola TaxID=3376284 RepID=UPI0037A6C698
MKNLRGRIAAAMMAGALMTGAFVAPTSASAGVSEYRSGDAAASLQIAEKKPDKKYKKHDQYIQVSHWKYDHKYKQWHRVEYYKHSHHNWAAKYAADKCDVKYNWAHKKAQYVEKHDVKHWSEVCKYKKHNTWYQVRYADNRH